MAHLILIRHSLPEFLPHVPAAEWHLSQEGHLRCIPLAIQLAHFQTEAMWCSQEPKALETGQILAARQNIACETLPGFEEHHRRTFHYPGLEDFETVLSHFFSQPQELIFGEETAEQALIRFSTATAGLVSSYAGRNLQVVTHGTVMTLFIAHHCGVEPLAFWKSLDMPSFVVLSLPNYRLISTMKAIPHNGSWGQNNHKQQR